jgi:hypothetical protein
VKRTKTQTSKIEEKESKKPDTTKSTYERWMTEEIPEYLGERVQEKKKRFKCGNERENRYWTEGEESRYKMCHEKRETI